jgi:hypothetical protein
VIPTQQSLQIRQFILTNLKEVPNSPHLKFRVNLTALENALVSDISDFPASRMAQARFDKSVLFVKGSQGRYIESTHEPEIYRLFPAASIVGFDAGHWYLFPWLFIHL